MKLNLNKLLIAATAMVLCISCKYQGYEKIYEKDGLIILESKEAIAKAKKKKSEKDSLHSFVDRTIFPIQIKNNLGVDPDNGKEIVDKKDATNRIERYQRGCGDNTRYVDMFFGNVKTYLESIYFQAGNPDNTLEVNRIGLRFYFATDSISPTVKKQTVIIGQIYNEEADPTKPQKINPLWITKDAEYKAFNFGSTCPEVCNSDITGIKP